MKRLIRIRHVEAILDSIPHRLGHLVLAAVQRLELLRGARLGCVRRVRIVSVLVRFVEEVHVGFVAGHGCTKIGWRCRSRIRCCVSSIYEVGTR